MSGVPREILRWLQSLDLSYSVKNPRRDLANGFVVAEIFSRYYRHDVSMHSFENSFSQKRKLNNWRCLERLFTKAKIPISRSLIDRVLVAEPGAAIQMLKAIYTLLTSKRVPSPDLFDEADFLPPFARPTASAIVKEKVHDNGDLAAEKELALRTIEAHEDGIRQERIEHPNRFVAVHEKATTTKATRFAQHVLSPEPGASAAAAAKSLQFVKNVVVKQVDMQQISDLQLSIDHRRAADASKTGTGVLAPVAAEATTKSVSEILDDAIQKRLQRPMKAAAFVLAVASMPDGVELALQVLADLMDPNRIQVMADVALQSTTQFWSLFAVLAPLLRARVGASAPTFDVVQRSTAQLLGQIGKAMALTDAFRARALFADFALPVVVDLVDKRAPILPNVLAMMFCFGPQSVDGDLEIVQRLHDALKATLHSADVDVFVAVLTEVVHAQAEFSCKSLDLFLYYTMIGLRSSSPATRANALRIGAAIARCPDVVEPLVQALDMFEECATDRWSPVQVELVRLMSTLLLALPDGHRSIDQIRHIVLSVVESASTSTLVQVTIVLSQNAAGHAVLHDMLSYIVQHRDQVRKTLVDCDGIRGKDRVPGDILDEIRRINSDTIAD